MSETMPPSTISRGGSRAPVGQRARSAAPPPSDFSKGLCQCCDDPGFACTMLCCGPTATGQLYERITSTPRSCFYISIALWGIFFLTSTLMSVGNAYLENAWYVEDDEVHINMDKVSQSTVILSLSSTFSFLGSVISTCVLCNARRRIRDRDNIKTGGCGDLEDCCVTYWCGCCSLTQMFYQEKVDGNNYNLVSNTGT